MTKSLLSNGAALDVDAWREEFPILSHCVYMLSNGFGAAPRAISAMIDKYTAECFELGEDGWQIWWPWLRGHADRVGCVIGAPEGSVTLDAGGVTAFMHRIASCFDYAGDRRRVVTSALDFPSVGYAWQAWERRGAERVVVESEDGIRVPVEHVCDAIDERTLLVAVSLANYGSGALTDVRTIADRAHAVGALILVDAFQAFGVVPVDVGALDADILVSGTRKFAMGSGDSSFMYVRPELIGRLEPTIVGWFGHEDPLAFSREFVPAPGVNRFQVGTAPVLPHYLASAGIAILEQVGLAAIRERSLLLTDRLIERADATGIDIATPREHDQRAGVVSLCPMGAQQLASALNEGGFRCSFRAGYGIRVAPHFYNTLAEVDAFMDALDARLRP